MFTPRITWPDLPVHVRDEVETVMGAQVVAWHGQTGGFSPGVADRLEFADGSRIFCKAVGESLNEGSAQLCRREIAVNRVLPEGLPVPQMRHGVELDDGWMVLLFDDLNGRHPRTPWLGAEFEAALTSLDEIALGVPRADESLPRVLELLGPDLEKFAEVQQSPPPTLDPWVSHRLPELVERSTAAKESLVGEGLCMLDARADNMVLDPAGKVWLVDWPWGCRGPAWLDTALLGMTTTLHQQDFDVASRVVRAVVGHGATPDDLINLWVGELGYFIHMAEQPAPPNLPTIRQYQAASRDGLIGALRQQLD